MDYDSWRFWTGIAQMAFNLIVSGYLWVSRKYHATQARVDAIEARMQTAETSLVKTETDLEHLPGQKQFEAIGRDIRLLATEIGEVKGRLDSLGRTLGLMNEFLINQGKK